MTGEPVVPISGLVPMLAVQDVESSAAFYALLGFAVGNRVPPTGVMHWAWLYAPCVPDWRRGPNPDARAQRPGRSMAKCRPLSLYLYATDLVALGTNCFVPGIHRGRFAAPDYLPKGEFPTA